MFMDMMQHKIRLVLLTIFICGCGNTEMYLYINDRGVDCLQLEKKVCIFESPKVIIKSNRPVRVEFDFDPETGKIKGVADAVNKNNLDKAIEGVLPLIALKNS